MPTVTAQPQATSTSTSASTPAKKSTLDTKEFLVLLTSELQYQDPLNPTSNAEYAGELAQLATVNGLDTMNDRFQAVEGSNLVGKHVVAPNPNGSNSDGSNNVDGTVTSVVVSNGYTYLNVRSADGKSTRVDITKITQLDNGN